MVKKIEVIEAKEDVLDFLKDTDAFWHEVADVYDQASKRIENNILALYQKYSDENGLSMVETKKLLTAEEFNVWRKDIATYVKEIGEQGKESKILLELNTFSTKSRINRQEELLSQIHKEMSEIAIKSTRKVEKQLQDVLTDNYCRGLYKTQKAAGIGFKVPKINHKLVQDIIAYPWSTKSFSKTIWDRTDLLCTTLRREISGAFIDGRSIQKLTSVVNQCMGAGRKNAERIVRTECKYFASQGQLMAYTKMGIKKYRFLGGGCAKCYAVTDAPIDIENAEVGLNYPPMHPNCKCTTVSSFDMSIFDDQRDVTPLNENVKFIEWKKHYLKG